MLPSQTVLHNGAFTIESVIGEGYFGITYRARDADENWVAIKECFPQNATRDGLQVVPSDKKTFAALLAGFETQAAILQQLSHPNLVRGLGGWAENNTRYLAMAFIEGESWLQKIEQNGPLHEDEAIEWISQIGEAVGAIHDAGFLHLDIKPENVLLNGETPILIDFDLMQRQEEAGFSTRPLHSILQCGTPGYAPIEQYAQRAPLSVATDLYALGATFYHLLTGAAPLAALERAAGLELIAPLEKRPDLAPDLNDAILAALQMAPNERPKSVRQWLEMVRDEKPHDAPKIVAPEGWYRIRLDSAKVKWPHRCACCFSRAKAALVCKAGGRKWPIPLCEHCRIHHLSSRKANAVTFWGIGASLVVVTGGVWLSIVGDSAWPLLLGPAGITINFATMTYGGQKNSRATELLKPTCTALDETLDYRFNGKIHMFRFRNAQFAAEFERLNRN